MYKLSQDSYDLLCALAHNVADRMHLISVDADIDVIEDSRKVFRFLVEYAENRKIPENLICATVEWGKDPSNVIDRYLYDALKAHDTYPFSVYCRDGIDLSDITVK